MKKLALSLLFSTALIFHNLTPSASITNLGPVQIITTNGSNDFAAGTVSLYGMINIGQSSSDVITLVGDGITNPSPGLESFLMIDSNGKVITSSGGGGPVTFGSLEAALTLGQTITFGIGTGSNNYFNFQSDSGNMTLQALATGSNLNLSAANNIVLSSSNITQPSPGNIAVLTVDSNRNVGTVNPTNSTVNFDNITTNTVTTGALAAGATTVGALSAATTSGNVSLGNVSGTINLYVNGISGITSGTTQPLVVNNNGLVSIANSATNMSLGNLVAASQLGQFINLGIGDGVSNYFGFTNNSGDVTLQANKIGSSLLLSADSYIVLNGFGLTTPGILTLDSNNRLSTSSSSSTAFTCGTLTAGANAGNSINLGITDASHNNITFNSDSGSVAITAGTTGATLDLTANSGILLNGSELNLTFPAVQSTLNLDGYIVLAVDRLNNLITSNSADLFKIGNDNSGNNFIAVDNATPSNGITLNSQALYLANQGLAPAAGYTNLLTIDSTGKIGIVVSSAKHKEEISRINLDESFNSLVPVSYKYKGNDHLEYGFIAEDLARIPALKNTVIYDQNGEPMSVNYQNVFVAVTADHIKVKEEVQTVKKELARVKAQYEKMQAIIAEMIKQGYLPTV
jgi:hypothetical protein